MSAADTSYDAKNVFHHIFSQILEEEMEKVARPEDLHLLIQRIGLAVITVRTRQGMVNFMIGQGALPGDALAAHMFRITYRRAVGE